MGGVVGDIGLLVHCLGVLDVAHVMTGDAVSTGASVTMQEGVTGVR